MALKRRIGWIFGVGAALALAGACSLNPQPIPPGAQSEEDGSAPTNAVTGDAGKGGSTGGGDGSDGSFSNDDGGDAGENLDASEDASDSGDE